MGEIAAIPRPAEVTIPGSMGEAGALISMIERAARDPAVNIEKMERLFEMHLRVTKDHARTAFFSAMSELQADLPAAVRRGTGHNGKRYARFEDVIETLRPMLKSHGFSLTYRIRQTDKITVVGVLAHAGGHAEETEFSLPPDTSGNKTAVHAIASSISYGKRYVALTLTGIATDDDDDGIAAGAGERISDDQHKQLIQVFNETNADVPGFCKYFNIAMPTELLASNFDRAVAALNKKAKQ